MIPLEQRIEEFLLSTPGNNGWVKGKELCALFDLPSDRALRKIGDRPGLATEFTISGNKGFKHIDRATPGEWAEYYQRERSHNISALVTLRHKRDRRHNVTQTIKKPAFTFEKDTKQGCLFNLSTSEMPF